MQRSRCGVMEKRPRAWRTIECAPLSCGEFLRGGVARAAIDSSSPTVVATSATIAHHPLSWAQRSANRRPSPTSEATDRHRRRAMDLYRHLRRRLAPICGRRLARLPAATACRQISQGRIKPAPALASSRTLSLSVSSAPAVTSEEDPPHSCAALAAVLSATASEESEERQRFAAASHWARRPGVLRRRSEAAGVLRFLHGTCAPRTKIPHKRCCLHIARYL